MSKLLSVADRGAERFVIVEETELPPSLGVMVYRVVDGRGTHDFWQDDIDMAIRCAEHEWQLPRSAWQFPVSDTQAWWDSLQRTWNGEPT